MYYVAVVGYCCKGGVHLHELEKVGCGLLEWDGERKKVDGVN